MRLAQSMAGETAGKFPSLAVQKVMRMLQDSNFISVSSGKAAEAIRGRDDEESKIPEKVAIATDLNENYEPFLTAGCEHVPTAINEILGESKEEFILSDVGLTDPDYEAELEGLTDTEINNRTVVTLMAPRHNHTTPDWQYTGHGPSSC